ncbi:MAG TPA: hypothetical protein VHF45_12925 [Thermoleophilaceae bacterium]|nr:hypothetical protein [Thermoleophilaceae bacterium]
MATRYSFTGAIERPWQVLRGGYLSWHDPKTDRWWQQVWFGARKQYRDLRRVRRGEARQPAGLHRPEDGPSRDRQGPVSRT